MESKERSIVVNRQDLQYFGEHSGSYFSFQEVTYIRQLEQNLSRKLRERGLTTRYSFSDALYQSRQMGACLELARRIAGSDFTVLIMGESGTGKELLAQSIHNASARSKQPFVSRGQGFPSCRTACRRQNHGNAPRQRWSLPSPPASQPATASPQSSPSLPMGVVGGTGDGRSARRRLPTAQLGAGARGRCVAHPSANGQLPSAMPPGMVQSLTTTTKYMYNHHGAHQQRPPTMPSFQFPIGGQYPIGNQRPGGRQCPDGSQYLTQYPNTAPDTAPNTAPDTAPALLS